MSQNDEKIQNITESFSLCDHFDLFYDLLLWVRKDHAWNMSISQLFTYSFTGFQDNTK